MVLVECIFLSAGHIVSICFSEGKKIDDISKQVRPVFDKQIPI
jgi:hypothetical protein